MSAADIQRYLHSQRELDGAPNPEHSGRGRVTGLRFLGNSPASEVRLSRYEHRIRDVPDLQAYYDLMDRFANYIPATPLAFRKRSPEQT